MDDLLVLFFQFPVNLLFALIYGSVGRRRGHSFWIWAGVGFWADIFTPMFILAWLPDRSPEKMRTIIMAQLDEQLAKAPMAAIKAVAIEKANAAQSVGDQETVPP